MASELTDTVESQSDSGSAPSGTSPKKSSLAATILKVQFSLFLCVLGAEFVLRHHYGIDMLSPFSNENSTSYDSAYNDHEFLDFVRRPHFQFGSIRTNAQGFLGGEIGEKKANTFRIFAFGGSTTEGSWLQDHDQKYPVLLGEALQERHPELDVEVYICATCDYKVIQSFNLFTLEVLKHQPDMVLIYHAVNDLVDHVRHQPHGVELGKPYRKDSIELLGYHLAKNSGICSAAYQLVRDAMMQHGNEKPETATSVMQSDDESLIAERRKHDEIRPEGFDVFERMLENFVVACKFREIPVVVSTFAIAAHRGMTPEEQLGLYFLYGHWTVEGFIENIERYNDRIRNVAGRQQVPMVDNYELIPHDFEYFTDGIHMSAEGFRLAAQNFEKTIVDAGVIAERMALRQPSARAGAVEGLTRPVPANAQLPPLGATSDSPRATDGD